VLNNWSLADHRRFFNTILPRRRWGEVLNNWSLAAHSLFFNTSMQYAGGSVLNKWSSTDQLPPHVLPLRSLRSLRLCAKYEPEASSRGGAKTAELFDTVQHHGKC
jgi:hypothetical protein